MSRTLACTLAGLVALASSPAHAECLWDSDCGRNGSCVSGICHNADGKPLEAPRSEADSEGPVHGGIGGGGWAVAGSIIGFGLGAATLGLAVGADVTRLDTLTALPLAGTATALMIAGGPLISAASNSARVNGAKGVPALRTIGWITYITTIIGGTGIGVASAIIGVENDSASDDSDDYWGYSEPDPPRTHLPGGVLTAAGLLGMASLTLFSVDALVAGLEGASLAEEGFAFSPFAAPLHTSGGGGVVGLSGSF